MRVTFEPPEGSILQNPSTSEVANIILSAPAAYWHSECGEAGVYCANAGGLVTTSIVLVFREQYGFMLQYFARGGTRSIFTAAPTDGRGPGDTGDSDERIAHVQSGRQLWLPRACFVDRSTAARVVGAFIDTGTGARPDGQWLEVLMPTVH